MKKIEALINPSITKKGFFAFKLQAIIEWLDKGFGNLWSHIFWSPILQLKYSNLLILIEIARIQCISSTTCEKKNLPILVSSLKLKTI